MIGVDFDNTIVCYDDLVHRIAVRQGLVPEAVPATKGHVRDYLRCQGMEEAWIELQGYLYGPGLDEASPFPGALDFFRTCRRQGVCVAIISHKTRHPFRGTAYDLHAAAWAWLEDHGFFDPAGIGLLPAQVHFELTKEAKVRRIVQAACTHFIDDLPEFLCEPAFPAGVHRILFDPAGQHAPDGCRCVRGWSEVNAWLAYGAASP